MVFFVQDDNKDKKKAKVLWDKKEIDFGRFHYISEYMDWSPDGKKLAYTKYHYGKNQSMIYDEVFKPH